MGGSEGPATRPPALGAPAGEVYEITMPKLGESVTEGTIGSWLKQVGDTVAFDDPLFEVSTDKVDSEIPSPYDGVVLEILVAAGETVPVGTVLARIGEPGATAAPAAAAAARGGGAPAAATAPTARPRRARRGPPASATASGRLLSPWSAGSRRERARRLQPSPAPARRRIRREDMRARDRRRAVRAHRAAPAAAAPARRRTGRPPAGADGARRRAARPAATRDEVVHADPHAADRRRAA